MVVWVVGVVEMVVVDVLVLAAGWVVVVFVVVDMDVLVELDVVVEVWAGC